MDLASGPEREDEIGAVRRIRSRYSAESVIDANHALVATVDEPNHLSHVVPAGAGENLGFQGSSVTSAAVVDVDRDGHNTPPRLALDDPRPDTNQLVVVPQTHCAGFGTGSGEAPSNEQLRFVGPA